MAQDHTAYIGTRFAGGRDVRFGIRRNDRRHHVYLVGRTGTGKTTLLQNLIVQDIEAGRGVGVIDPHGDLAEQLLDHIPPRRADDVVYFNPADQAWPIAFNMLHGVPQDRRHLVAAEIVSVFKSIWRDSWGPRMEYILSACLAALLECENTTILGVQRMLVDAKYRRWVVKQVTDPVVKSFWLDEFEQYDPRFMREAIAPIQNKVGQLLMAAPVRNILGQVRRMIDPRFMMDNRRIFIANLAKGQLGAEKANLLGSVLVTQFQLAAMARSSVAEEEREDWHLFVDEFHNFTTDSFAGMLSEARKYRLCLVLSHQYMDQLSDDIKGAVLGNAGTVISFRVGESDAEVMKREFGRNWQLRVFTELKNYEICCKLLVNGDYGEPFVAKTMPPAGTPHDGRAGLIQRCREKYSVHRDVVEDKIKRWMQS